MDSVLAVDSVFVLDKAAGQTSHDAVAAVRKRLGQKRVGHAGTLDPMATGVLVVAAGEATKLVPYLTSASKEYEATIALGRATDTLVADGRETARAPVPADWRDHLDAALAAERARTEQEPPAFSAIHADGERAHVLARRGESVTLAPRPVSVESLDLLGADDAAIRLRLSVSKGYYVRALARDLAARLGTLGHLTSLRRIRAGSFTLADVGAEPMTIEAAASRALPVTTLTDAGAVHARAGRRVPLDQMSSNAPGDHAWIGPDGKLIAIGRIDEGSGRVLRGIVAHDSKD